MPRVLIMASPEQVSQLASTVLWRADVDRVFTTAEAVVDRIQSARPDLVILGGEDTAATLADLARLRGDARTRGLSLGVVRRSLTLEEETQLRRGGANVVLGGEVVPYLWDAWLEELLNVPPRRDARVPVRLAVWSHAPFASDPGRGMSVNVSVKGMLLETTEALDVGARLELSFTLPASGPVRAVGQVVREESPAHDGCPRLGVEFVVLREGARDRIRSYVEAGGEP